MQIKQAEFVKSTTDLTHLPEVKLPEFAFVGRSNVGKSSLINMLLKRKQMAKTSQKPGKTRTINHYQINQKWYMVDLPGYGYAQTSKKERQTMLRFIKEYLLYAPELINLFVLLDARLSPKDSDLQFMEWLGINEIPFTMVFTKVDKISSAQLTKNMDLYRQEMLKTWEFLPVAIKSSAISKLGRDEILSYIDDLLTRIIQE